MSPKRKCHPNPNVNKANVNKKMSQKNKFSLKRKCHQKANDKQPKCHKNINVTQFQISPKPKCHQNAIVT